jgi:energy-coupling factor transporter ATP-binding protein EcfA2
LQIFAYLIFYRPKLFLVDEPDSHLHPDRQEKLVNVLIAAAEKLDTQVVMATHSPSVVRSLGADATIVWMQDGTVTGDIVQARKQMGWGLLDKKILVLSEDSNVRLLKNLIEQWPDIDRRTAVWPLNGVKTLPAPESLSGMKSLFGDSMQLVLHRDGDFLNKDERKCWAKPYEEKGITPWITPASDLEACFLSAEIISKVLGIDETTAIELLRSAIESRKDNCEKNFAEKREEHRKNNKLRIKGASIPSNEEVKKELLSSSIIGASVGKEIAKQLRQDTNGAYSNSGDLAKVCPEGAIVAPCLKAILEKLLN